MEFHFQLACLFATRSRRSRCDFVRGADAATSRIQRASRRVRQKRRARGRDADAECGCAEKFRCDPAHEPACARGRRTAGVAQMNFLQKACCWLAVCATGQLAVFPLHAENPASVPAPIKLLSTTANAAAAPRSPVDFFRQLLAMSPDERDNFLTNHPPEIRKRILAKVAEY